MSKYDILWKYVAESGREKFKLTFDEIEAVAGFPIDHSFLNFKKELIPFGYKVGPISQKLKTVTFEKVEADEADETSVLPTRFQLPVECILQNPELPTGCEAVSLTTVLQFLGYKLDKFTIVDRYLPRGPVGPTDPYYAFPGDPYSLEGGWGCFGPCIEDTANRFIQDYESGCCDTDQGGSKEGTAAGVVAIDTAGIDGGLGVNVAVDVSHTPFARLASDYLYKYKRPVVIWGSLEMKPHTVGPTWTLPEFVTPKGEHLPERTYTWRSNNHCLVLIGWDEENYIFSDPMEGIRAYSKEAVEMSYNNNDQQAVVILAK